MSAYRILTASLLRFCNPFRDDVWGTGVMRRAEIARCIAEGDIEDRPNEVWTRCKLSDDEALRYDARRIAFLVQNPSIKPVELDIGDYLPHGPVIIVDGCHRIGAAAYRRDPMIAVDFGGDIDLFHRLFRRKEKIAA
jgi:hypothetical protein